MMNEVRLAILQPSSLCNLNCKYCYVPDRKNRKLMSEEVICRAAQLIFSVLPPGQKTVSLLWHAGEPLAAGQDFYKRAFHIIKNQAAGKVHVRHVFQSNATLITDSWCDIFHDHDVSIGVSIDGPKKFHDQQRVSWSQRGSFDRTMRGVTVLRRRGYNPTAICVLTPKSLAEPDIIYDFFLENNFPSVGFNIEESEGDHARAAILDEIPSLIKDKYINFMRKFWKRCMLDKSALRVREFERELSMIEALRLDKNFVAVPDEVKPFANIVVTRDGGIATFAPELASTISTKYNNFIIGNVLEDDWLSIKTGAPFARLARDIEAGRNACRTSCAYFPVCGGGFQSNRYAEHQSLAATETSTCRLHRKALTDVVLSELELLS